MKLSLDALKAKSNNVISADVMDKITGGNKSECHCVVAGQGEYPLLKCTDDDGAGS